MIRPYYDKGNITIYHGDCREIMPHLGPVDLVVTDPPYGIKHPTNYHSRGRSKLAICRDYLEVYGDDKPFEPQPLLDLQKPICLWGANHYSNKLPSSPGWLVWDKKRPDNLDQATCELAYTNFVKGVRRFTWLWNGMIRKEYRGSEPLYQPTQKPIALMIWVLSLRWTPQGIVLDPFMGSGTTLVAAKELGRKAIGIEIEEKYCEIAVKRLRQNVLDFSNEMDMEKPNQRMFDE